MNHCEKIYYNDRSILVMLGDHVQTVIWFRKRYGRVVYVPGTSKPNGAMEDEGRVYVGIQIDGGPFVATVVEPEGCFIKKKKVVFLRRGHEDFSELDSQCDPFKEERADS